jgi:hypothetical protein
MSSVQNTGGPAFPLVIPPEHSYSTGMTLRDYFAAKAMQSTFDSPIETTSEGKYYIAMHAYKMADAMLKAREQ